MKRRQCKKCPWKKGTDPRTIPNGYCEARHRGLSKTLGDPGKLHHLRPLMACHETKAGNEKVCVGWLANQLGPGNNLPLRLAVINGQIDADFELVGEQHERFEDTLPKSGTSCEVCGSDCASRFSEDDPKTGILYSTCSGCDPALWDPEVEMEHRSVASNASIARYGPRRGKVIKCARILR